MMQKGKKILILLFAIILSFGVALVNAPGATAYAADKETSYYYERLTDAQKEIYDAIEEHYLGEDGLYNGETESMVWVSPTKTLTHSEAVVNAAGACTAFMKENQQINAILGGYSIQYTYGATSDGYAYIKQITVTYKRSSTLDLSDEEIAAYNAGVTEAVEEITNSLSANASEYEKVRAIHDWLCNRVSYNYDAPGNHSTYPEAWTVYPVFGDVEERQVVCEGYARAFQALCHMMNVTCVYVTGEAGSGDSYGGHAWNKVRMPDGKWYGVDTTWDDQVSKIYYDYFLCGRKTPCYTGLTFEEDHLEDEDETGIPETAEYGYNGYLDFGDAVYSYNDGGLTISGNGTIPEFLHEDHAPWYPYKDEITSIVVGEGITSISKGCFAGLDKVESITIPYVGLSKDATGGNAKYYIIFGSSASSVPASLKRIVVTNDDNLEAYAFYNCKATTIEIPGSVTSIGGCAFQNCTNLQTVILNEGIEEISSYCFSGCTSLTEIEIPGSVTSIGSYAFGSCTNLQTVILHEGIEEISSGCFSGCTSLTKLEIPGSVTSITKNRR